MPPFTTVNYFIHFGGRAQAEEWAWQTLTPIPELWVPLGTTKKNSFGSGNFLGFQPTLMYMRVVTLGSGRSWVARELVFQVQVASGIKFLGQVVG